MKKSIGLLLVLALSLGVAKAQEFKKFRVGVGAGYASPSGSGAKGGVLLYLEPGYRVADPILVNLRLETAVVARGSANASSASVDVKALGSYTLNGQYYFSSNNFRPFAGIGFGLYNLAAASVDVDNGNGGTVNQTVVASASKFGFYPRVGFDAGHFQFSIDYNVVPETSGLKNSYLGVRIGGFFGGGRK
jgi:outer membrane protein W